MKHVIGNHTLSQMKVVSRASSETKGQIVEARGSLNGRKKMATKKSIVALLCFSSSPFSFARLDFPLPPRSAPGSPRMFHL